MINYYFFFIKIKRKNKIKNLKVLVKWKFNKIQKI
jgi:hypothetical protein